MMDIDYSKLYTPTISKSSSDLNEIDEILEVEEILYVISKNIILYRQLNKLTQKQLADKLEVNQPMISKLESGNYNPTFKEIYKITRKLPNDSELYKKILEEIIDNLNKYEKMQYNISIYYDEKENNKEGLYLIKTKNKIKCYSIEKENEGEGFNGEYNSEISNVG